jgi:hypothetical protein
MANWQFTGTFSSLHRLTLDLWGAINILSGISCNRGILLLTLQSSYLWEYKCCCFTEVLYSRQHAVWVSKLLIAVLVWCRTNKDILRVVYMVPDMIVSFDGMSSHDAVRSIKKSYIGTMTTSSEQIVTVVQLEESVERPVRHSLTWCKQHVCHVRKYTSFGYEVYHPTSTLNIFQCPSFNFQVPSFKFKFLSQTWTFLSAYLISTWSTNEHRQHILFSTWVHPAFVAHDLLVHGLFGSWVRRILEASLKTLRVLP